MKIINYIILFYISIISPQLYALPNAYSASYKVSKSGLLLGSMQVSLVYQGNQYYYHKLTKASGVAAILSGDTLVENSSGRIQDGQLITLKYLRHHKSKRKVQKDEFIFKTPTLVQGTFNQQAYQLNVPQGTSDLSLLEVKLMQDIAKGGLHHSYNIVDRGKLKQYLVRKLGQADIEVPMGKYTCEKVRISQKNKSQHTTVWLAKELNFVPVRILHEDDDGKLDIRLTNYRAK